MTWQSSYVALQTDDKLNRQQSQKNDSSALQGSFGYGVPKEVQEVIGGNAVGAATITAPAQPASTGPLATGGPITYTVTGADGSVATQTSTPGGSGGSSSGSQSSGGPNVGAIVAGVIAGCFAVLAVYLGFCAWVYRRQLQLYKNHTAMAQNQALSGGDHRFHGAGFLGVGKLSNQEKSQTSDSRNSADNRSGNGSNISATGRANALHSNNPYKNVPGGAGTATAASSTDDLMAGQEPSFLGVMLNPRRSLRVVNRD